MSQLSRRSLVARVAALPLSAPAALASIPTADASETVIERLAAELALARDRHSTACEHLDAVDEARFDWQEVWEKLNPRPAKPPRSAAMSARIEALVHELTDSEDEREWSRAFREYESAVKEWEKRRDADQPEHSKQAAVAEDLVTAAVDEVGRVENELVNTQARSLQAIKIKAEIALAAAVGCHDDDLAWSIVEDITRLATA
jgi:hypothetical protein